LLGGFAGDGEIAGLAAEMLPVEAGGLNGAEGGGVFIGRGGYGEGGEQQRDKPVRMAHNSILMQRIIPQPVAVDTVICMHE
jgi:hypothetical protein